jgi:hypothetical protein
MQINHNDTCRLVLDWARDANGQKCPSITNTQDTCDRLAVLLAKSTMLAFLDRATSSVVSPQSNPIYNYTPAYFITSPVARGSSVDFLLDLYTDLVRESASLRMGSSSIGDDQTYGLNVTKQIVLERKQLVLDMCDYLLGRSKTMPVQYDEVVELFNYGHANGFIREYIKMVHIYYNHGADMAYTSQTFRVPCVSREGYRFMFEFCDYLTGSLIYNSISLTGCSNVEFIERLVIPNASSDTYLWLLASYAVTTELGEHHNGLAILLNNIMHSTEHTFIATAKLMAGAHGIGQLVRVLAGKFDRERISVGKCTHVMLSLFATTASGSSEFTAMIAAILNTTATVESLSRTSPLYVESLDRTSRLYRPPTNIWAAEGDDPAPGDDEEPEEDTPKEDNDVPDEPPEMPTEPGEDPSQDTPPEPMPQGEPGSDTAKNEPITVKVPKNSYLLKMAPPDSNTLEEYLYRVEVANIIANVLDTESEEISETDRLYLSDFVRKWLYLVDIVSLDSIIRKIIKAVPAMGGKQ